MEYHIEIYNKFAKKWMLLNPHTNKKTEEGAKERLAIFQEWDKNAGLENKYRIITK
jgi:mRNA-degrading endonuclease RelE of RelBE toxin-antitoxin system